MGWHNSYWSVRRAFLSAQDSDFNRPMPSKAPRASAKPRRRPAVESDGDDDAVVTGVVSPGPVPPPSSEKKKGKAKKTLADFDGFSDLPSSATTVTGGTGKKKGKPIEARLHLAVHQKNDKNKGKLTGRVFYVINPVYDENEAYVLPSENNFIYTVDINLSLLGSTYVAI